MTVSVLLGVFVSSDAGAAYPPVCVEVTTEHPFLVFEDSGKGSTDAVTHAQHVVQVWQGLPEDLRPFSAIQIEACGADIAARHQWFRGVLMTLQDADIPAVLRLADSDLARVYPLERAEELLKEFPCIKGIQAVSLPFEEYYEFGYGDPAGMPPVIRWLLGATEIAAQYGRLIMVELDQIRWPRLMSSVWSEPLYGKFRECAPYVVPIASCRGPHTIAQTSATMGLWLEGATAQWGVGPSSRWYGDAHFVDLGVCGLAGDINKTPSSLYRAMIMNGAMTGATVYSFAPDDDLWFGSQRRHWDEAIYPTLARLIDGGLIARQDLVKKKTTVAYQLAISRTPQDFHLNLRDIDGILDKGFLMHGAYGMERPGQMPELIPNTGRHYWIPILSAYAPKDVLATFGAVIQPGVQTSADSWRELLDTRTQPDGEGTAFIARVGRGTFVMNTCENRNETQTFRIDGIPAPVRQITARRQDTGVMLAWPFREGDLSYKVYRRIPPETQFTLIANAVEGRQYLDSPIDPNQTVGYSVTALTDDQTAYEGTVNYGEHLILSNVESRVAEEVIITPLLPEAQSRSIEMTKTPQPSPPWWPVYPGVPEAQLPVATAIVQQIEAWDRAFSQKDLNQVVALYAAGYTDPQGWGLQYVRRAYQWFFEHYHACMMHRQIRQWDFAPFENSGQVGVLLYCQFTGFALTDVTGRIADLPARFPRTDTGDVWIYFGQENGAWRIQRTDPAVPNFRDILSYSSSPFDSIPPGPDSAASGN